MEAARARGIPVAAHCGSSRMAQRFAALGGRSVEHGYALDEAAAAPLRTAAPGWCRSVLTFGRLVVPLTG